MSSDDKLFLGWLAFWAGLLLVLFLKNYLGGRRGK